MYCIKKGKRQKTKDKRANLLNEAGAWQRDLLSVQQHIVEHGHSEAFLLRGKRAAELNDLRPDLCIELRGERVNK